MKHLKRFNENLENLDIYKKELQKIDDSGIVEGEYKYYVGSVKNTKIYALYHGTFKGFNKHDDVLEYIQTLKSKGISFRIFSSGEYKEIDKKRKQGQ